MGLRTLDTLNEIWVKVSHLFRTMFGGAGKMAVSSVLKQFFEV